MIGPRGRERHPVFEPERVLDVAIQAEPVR